MNKVVKKNSFTIDLFHVLVCLAVSVIVYCGGQTTTSTQKGGGVSSAEKMKWGATYKEVYDKALAAHNNKQYNEAIEGYLVAAKFDGVTNEDQANLLRHLGDVWLNQEIPHALLEEEKKHYREEIFNSAMKFYNKAIELNPNDRQPYNSIVNAYFKKNDPDGAIAFLSNKIRLNPDHAIAYFNRGKLYHRIRDYDKAIADYESTLQITPNDENVKRELEIVKAELAGQVAEEERRAAAQAAEAERLAVEAAEAKRQADERTAEEERQAVERRRQQCSGYNAASVQSRRNLPVSRKGFIRSYGGGVHAYSVGNKLYCDYGEMLYEKGRGLYYCKDNKPYTGSINVDDVVLKCGYCGFSTKNPAFLLQRKCRHSPTGTCQLSF